MAVLVDLDQLARIFGRQGERVVLVLPSGDSVVLVPLSEYEQLVGGTRAQAKPVTLEAQPRRSPGRRPAPKPIEPMPAQTKSESPESIDPLQGGLSDDDQYFPEPLE